MFILKQAVEPKLSRVYEKFYKLLKTSKQEVYEKFYKLLKKSKVKQASMKSFRNF